MGGTQWNETPYLCRSDSVSFNKAISKMDCIGIVALGSVLHMISVFSWIFPVFAIYILRSSIHF